MRILLDECVPRPLARELSGHYVASVADMGWQGKKNGELLAMITGAGLDAFITVDQNLRYQQNLTVASIAVIILVAATNRMLDLLPLVPQVLTVLTTIRPGDVIEVSQPLPP